jgi:hypothetical protein
MEDWGYIKLHRTITKWQWFKHPLHYNLFTKMLLMAKHSYQNKGKMTIKPGEFTATTGEIALITGLSESSVKRVLDDLIKTGEITKDTETTKAKYTLYKINNWDYWQSGQDVGLKEPTVQDVGLGEPLSGSRCRSPRTTPKESKNQNDDDDRSANLTKKGTWKKGKGIIVEENKFFLKTEFYDYLKNKFSDIDVGEAFIKFALDYENKTSEIKYPESYFEAVLKNK